MQWVQLLPEQHLHPEMSLIIFGFFLWSVQPSPTPTSLHFPLVSHTNIFSGIEDSFIRPLLFINQYFFVYVFFPDVEILSKRWCFYFIFFFLISASHGILDALTNGGLGIALLAPFDNTRYFFSWRPIMVSPISVGAFFSKWGLMVIKRELLWVWLPSLIMVVVSTVIRVMPVRHWRIGG